MARLYLMCGLPFSGKSTVARHLSRRLECDVVSFDAINRERGLGFAGEREITVAEWAETYRTATDRVARMLRSGRDVILDDVMGFACAREEFRLLAAEYGAETCVVYLDVPLRELRRRREQNLVCRERPDVRPEIIERVAAAFEVPSAAENPVLLRGMRAGDVSPDQWARWITQIT